MGSVNAAAVVDNVPPGETLKAGWTKYNAHYHEYDSATLTNKLGSSLAVGDVVAISTANDSSVVLDDTTASVRPYVVAYEAVAADATGEFCRSGVASAKSSGTIVRGNFVRKSSTARSIEDTGIASTTTHMPPKGTLGVALAGSSGGFTTIFLFGATMPGDFISVYNRVVSDITIANSTTETSIYSTTINANDLGTSNGFRFSILGKITNTSGSPSVITARVKYGTTTIATIVMTLPATSVTDGGILIQGTIFEDGATNAQLVLGYIEHNTSYVNARGTGAEDTTTDKTFEITFQWTAASASRSYTREVAFLEYMPAV